MVGFEKMRHRITLQAPTNISLNSISEQTPIYENVAEVWAEVLPLRGREYQESQKLQAETQYRVLIRYRDDVQANWRVIWRGNQLQITDVLDTNGLREQLELMCFEKVAE